MTKKYRIFTSTVVAAVTNAAVSNDNQDQIFTATVVAAVITASVCCCCNLYVVVVAIKFVGEKKNPRWLL